MRSIPATIVRPESKRKQHRIPFWRLLALAAAAMLSGCATEGVRDNSHSFHTVVVDAGHGGHDSGTRSSRLVLEKDAALDIALKLDGRLRSSGFNTVVVRKGDYFVPLDERVRISNAQPDAVFVSVHLNEARRRTGIHGVETYYYSSQSAEMAQRILGHVGAVSGELPHGMHTARFRVLRNNLNPAVLVECGYLSNPSEAARFASPDYRSQIAAAIAAGIVEQRSGR
jgi:N-acetylmuramoyl-L-alanine amidase